MCLGPKTQSLEIPKTLHAQVLDNPAGVHRPLHCHMLDRSPHVDCHWVSWAARALTLLPYLASKKDLST